MENIRKVDRWTGGYELSVVEFTSDPYDPYDSVYASPLRLHEAGVLFGFQSNSGSGSRQLPFHAGMAVAFGLPRDVALRSVTLIDGQPVDVDDNKHTRLYRQYQQRLSGQ